MNIDEMKDRIARAEEIQRYTEIRCEALEKENAELQDKLKNLASVAEVRLANWQKYEKENAELRKESEVVSCNTFCRDNHFHLQDQLTKAKELIKELSKSLFLAKGIVRDLIDDTVDFKESKERASYCYEQESFNTYKKAEQFLQETDIDNAIQQANKVLDFDKIADEMEQDLKDSEVEK